MVGVLIKRNVVFGGLYWNPLFSETTLLGLAQKPAQKHVVASAAILTTRTRKKGSLGGFGAQGLSSPFRWEP